MEKFPKVLFVRRDSNNQAFDPIACTREQDAVEDDGPTRVARYVRSRQREEVEEANRRDEVK